MRAYTLMCLATALLVATTVAWGQAKDPYTAAGAGDVAAVRAALAAKPLLIGETDPKYGATLLHWAALTGQVKIADALYAAGGDVSALDAAGRTPLHWAAERGQVDCVAWLMDKEVDHELQDYTGKSAADRATAAGHRAIAELIATSAHPALAPARLTPFGAGMKHGYIDTTGKTIIEATYAGAYAFSDGLAAVEIQDRPGVVTGIGYIDRTGAMVIEPTAMSGRGFRHGLACVYTNYRGQRRTAFIDHAGRIVFVVDNEGTRLADPRATGAQPSVDGRDPYGGFTGDGLALMRSGEKYGHINRTGKFAIAPQYVAACDFSEGMAAVMVDGKWGFINTAGEMVIPAIYDTYSADPNAGGRIDPVLFRNGLATVRKGDKYGYIDKAGKELIPLDCRWAAPFSEGLGYVVRANGTRQFIDRTGKPAFMLPRTNASAHQFAAFHGGRAVVTGDAFTPVIINRAGTTVATVNDARLRNRTDSLTGGALLIDVMRGDPPVQKPMGVMDASGNVVDLGAVTFVMGAFH